MEENNVCAPTTVSPRVEDCHYARAGLWQEHSGSGARLSGKSQSTDDLARRMARQRRAGVSRTLGSSASEAGRRAHPGAGAQDRTDDDGDRLFKKSLATFQGASAASYRQWSYRLYQQIREAAKAAQAEVAVNRLCEVAGVSRAGYYRFLQPGEAEEADMDLRSAIQAIALEWPAYGYRRVHAELRARGWVVNHKRVLRLMRADNLLCLRRRKFILTTDSKHELPIYPNLAQDMVLTGINQLWVADITYIRLAVEFVYLAVLLDAFSRSCVGWALQRSLEAPLVLEALHMALGRRRPQPGLVHHSDRGVQYASRDYTQVLEQHGIRISMSRRGNVYDNSLGEERKEE